MADKRVSFCLGVLDSMDYIKYQGPGTLIQAGSQPKTAPIHKITWPVCQALQLPGSGVPRLSSHHPLSKALTEIFVKKKNCLLKECFISKKNIWAKKGFPMSGFHWPFQWYPLTPPLTSFVTEIFHDYWPFVHSPVPLYVFYRCCICLGSFGRCLHGVLIGWI